jgi:predicted nucleotidyltransferase
VSKKEIDQKIKEVSQKVASEFKPKKIILFGSYAWGKPHRDSDIDLLIVKNTKDTRKLAREIDGSIFPRSFPIDVIVYEPKQIEERLRLGDFFISSIISKGKVLYEN